MNTTWDYYGKNAADFATGTRDVDFSAVRSHFTAFLPRNYLILDLRCGSGRDSKAFLEEGYDVLSMDGSSEMCRLAEQYIQHAVINLTFDQLDYDEAFEGI